MAGYQPVNPNHEGDQHLIAAAHHILKLLGAIKNLSDDTRKLLADLDIHLSIMTGNTVSNGGEATEVEKQLKCAERMVLRWEANQSKIWDTGPGEVSEFLGAIDEVQTLIDSFSGVSVNENGRVRELIHRANNILQMAMLRLQEGIIHILVHHKLYFEPEYVSFHSCQEDVIYDESFVSLEDESVEASQRVSNTGSVSGEYLVDLIHPQVVPDLKAIASAMIAANYDQEFCEAFIGTRRDALNEYFFVILELEKFSIDDVLKMKWSTLSSEIKKWNWAMKIIIRVYLTSEKQLCKKILGGFDTVCSLCFVEIAKATFLCLLNFGEAVAMGSTQPEKLFCLLDMYEVLDDLLPEIDSLLFEETGSYIRIEFHELLRKLGHSARQAFQELQKAIAADSSMKPLPRGGIHPLTRYVMNYIKTLTIYDDTLNLLFEDQNTEDTHSIESETEQDISLISFCPLACHLRSITSALECSLVVKSRLYREDSLRHIFLMNNIHYVVQKIKGSDLRIFFGDEWIRKHIGKFQQHATSYQRATWCSVLSFLRDDGHCSNSALKTSYKERCREFTNAFEDVYKIQTQWSIPDPQLKEDLRISTSLKVIHAYRTFIGRNRISDKHIKYTVDDLEKLLLDFFEGTWRTLRNSRRR